MQAVVYHGAIPIVPSDTVDLHSTLMDGIAVGGAGVVSAVLQDDRVVPFTCQTGQILPLRCKRVNATGTTATALVALWRDGVPQATTTSRLPPA